VAVVQFGEEFCAGVIVRSCKPQKGWSMSHLADFRK
jgi:hypothetical protein